MEYWNSRDGAAIHPLLQHSGIPVLFFRGVTEHGIRNEGRPHRPVYQIMRRKMRRGKMPQSLHGVAPCSSTREIRRNTRLCDISQTPDGQGRIRTYAGLRQWVYSPSPLAARAPVQFPPGRLNRGQATPLNETPRPLSTQPHDFFHRRIFRFRLQPPTGGGGKRKYLFRLERPNLGWHGQTRLSVGSRLHRMSTVKRVWRCHPANGRLHAKHVRASPRSSSDAWSTKTPPQKPAPPGPADGARWIQ
jgi:hypothetical protein